MYTIKILSLNCFGIPISFNRKLRFSNIAAKIIEINPDLVLLQEVWVKSDRKIFNEILSKNGYQIYPPHPNNFDTGGLVLLARNIKVDNFMFHKFTDQGPLRLVTLPDHIGGKGFQIFKIKLGVKEAVVINTHLLASYGRQRKILDSIQNQLNQIAETVGVTKAPLLIAGDLNLFPFDSLLSDFKNKLGLKDKLKNNDFTVNPKNLNRGRLMNLYTKVSIRCDYVLTNKLFKVAYEKIIFKEILISDGKRFQLSDHFAIFAEILL